MKSVYGSKWSKKELKNEIWEYLKHGELVNAVNVYEGAGEIKKAAKLTKYLEKAGGNEKEACKRYIRKRFVVKQVFQSAGIILAATSIGSACTVAMSSMKNIAEGPYFTRSEKEVSYHSERIPSETRSPAGAGSAVGFFLGLWGAAANYRVGKEKISENDNFQ